MQEYRRELGQIPEAARAHRVTKRGGKPSAAASREPEYRGAGEQAAAAGGFNMASVIGDYERGRAWQVERNRAVLERMGLLRHGVSAEMRGAQPKRAGRKRPRALAAHAGPSRRSGRATKKPMHFGDFAPEGWHRGAASGARTSSAEFGAVAGVNVGKLWLSRVGCSRDGVHGPWVGGIHGGGKTGAYSVVLSGGYEGDEDAGHSFTFTGSGGRDLSGNRRTAPQSRDQDLRGGNRALAVNIWRQQPMRVVRGYKLGRQSRFAPSAGYRYDGLYMVTGMWPEIGASGFVLWRYRMERLGNQEAAPWEADRWKASEEKALATLKAEQGDAPLIPAGTGTTALAPPMATKPRRSGP